MTHDPLRVAQYFDSNAVSTRWDDLLDTNADADTWTRLLDLEGRATQAPGVWGVGTHIICVASRGDGPAFNT